MDARDSRRYRDLVMEREFTIYLDEFYENDTVIVHIDGIEVYNRQGVTTKLTISLADEFKVKSTKDEVEISVEVPTRKARKEQTFRVEGEEPKVTISVHDGFIDIRSSPEAGYL